MSKRVPKYVATKLALHAAGDAASGVRARRMGGGYHKKLYAGLREGSHCVFTEGGTKVRCFSKAGTAKEAAKVFGAGFTVRNNQP